MGIHPGQPRRRHGGPSRRVDLAGIAQALGHREHRRQCDLHLLRTVVVLQFQGPDRAPVVQPADAAGEGEIEQFGQLRAHLARLPVDGVTPEEDQVEGPCGAQDSGQRARCGQGVRAREGGVAGVHPGVGAPGHRLAQTSSAPGGPSVTTVQVPPVARASETPWATARRQ